jgi:Putative peptidoglycan binding domain
MFEAPTVESQVSGADNWLSDETAPTRGPRFVRADFSPRQRAVATGAVALVFVLVGLAVAGVFSGGGRPRTQATSTLPRTTAPVSTPTAVTTPGPATTLKAGSSGPQVKTLQRALASLGYSPGSVDGQYGSATERALARFQQAQNLAADGILGPATLAALTHALNNRG